MPCLGIGVLKRKPDIKWHRNKEDIKEITKLQKEIFNTCSKYLKKGGELVYSNCSILKEENGNIVDEFLEKNTNFEIVKYNLDNENYFRKFVKDDRYIQVYQNDKTDGFFICKMLKN